MLKFAHWTTIWSEYNGRHSKTLIICSSLKYCSKWCSVAQIAVAQFNKRYTILLEMNMSDKLSAHMVM
jgi:hypothetical protein